MMALSMCPLEEEAPIVRAPPQKQDKNPPRAVPTMEEETECNYVILFFIVGVIVLALLDAA
jgi:hypothetical protein